MSTPSSGAIKFSDITSEFGTPTGKNLGAFRISQSIAGKTWPLDTGVPSSGSIKFSQLRGKTLNVVVDYSGADEYRVDASSKYSTGVVVGGFKSLPTRTGTATTKKVINVIRKTIGAATDSTGQATGLRTGNWDSSTTELKFIITSTGEVYGAGGKGGNMSASLIGNGVIFTQNGTAEPGGNGTHAFGASYSCSVEIESGGRLQCGYGGGSAGETGAANPDGQTIDPYVFGGAGGGGAGWPVGDGGIVNPPNAPSYSRQNNIRSAQPGNAGTKTVGGDGGYADAGNIVFANHEGGIGGGGSGVTVGVSPTYWHFPSSQGENGLSNRGGYGGVYNSNAGGQYRTVRAAPGSNGSAIIRSSLSITVSVASLPSGAFLFGATDTVGSFS